MDLDPGPIRRVHRRAPLNDPRSNAREDVDWKDSQTDTSRRILGATERTCEKVLACRHY